MSITKYLDTFGGGGSGGGAGGKGPGGGGRGKGPGNTAKGKGLTKKLPAPRKGIKGLLRKMPKEQRKGPAKGFALGKTATSEKRLGRIGRAAADATDRFSAKNVARNIRAGEKVDMKLFSRSEVKQIRTALKKAPAKYDIDKAKGYSLGKRKSPGVKVNAKLSRAQRWNAYETQIVGKKRAVPKGYR